jgi:Domain of unknown function (DUF4407)
MSQTTTVARSQPSYSVVEETEESARLRRLRYRNAADGIRPFSAGRTTARAVAATCWLSGAETRLLAACPWDTTRYLAIGGSIALSTLLSMACTFGLSILLGSPVLVAALVSAVWGLLSLTADRLMCASLATRMPSRANLWRRLGIAIVGVIVKLCFGYLAASMVLVGLFRTEIHDRLHAQLNVQSQQKSVADSQVQAAERDLQGFKSQYEVLLRDAIVHGDTGSGDRARQLFESIIFHERQLGLLEAHRDGVTEVANTFTASYRDRSILSALSALGDITSSTPGLSQITLGTRAIVIVIMLQPVLLALISGTMQDSYKTLVAARERWFADGLAQSIKGGTPMVER